MRSQRRAPRCPPGSPAATRTDLARTYRPGAGGTDRPQPRLRALPGVQLQEARGPAGHAGSGGARCQLDGRPLLWGLRTRAGARPRCRRGYSLHRLRRVASGGRLTANGGPTLARRSAYFQSSPLTDDVWRPQRSAQNGSQPCRHDAVIHRQERRISFVADNLELGPLVVSFQSSIARCPGGLVGFQLLEDSCASPVRRRTILRRRCT